MTGRPQRPWPSEMGQEVDWGLVFVEGVAMWYLVSYRLLNGRLEYDVSQLVCEGEHVVGWGSHAAMRAAYRLLAGRTE